MLSCVLFAFVAVVRILRWWGGCFSGRDVEGL